MKRVTLALMILLAASGAMAHGHPGPIDDSVPDAQRIRFCERVRDHALQAFYNRDKGRPMKLFDEDGSDGARITNHIIRRIYDEPQISSPKKAETFGRATCNEMMGTKQPSE
ncbi:MAG: hypothetical protein IV101_21860 [Dechloromonas sp.]|uniref:hypothetical protein n=1 Tax=Azonexaceae TaxID=2008795 RepID=UPI001CF8BEB8|nr:MULTISPECIES: hypothetical protein [Azonexaceae]MBT9523530.1 hypothetical protein [Dechloromonas sp.]UCV21425.1 hypothetical protein KI613_12805 [Ferribacterium limneticum]